MNTVLEVENITKKYEKATAPSLRGVSFSVEEGEFIAIMGASGSGKTTLLNVLSTIDKASSGKILINGTNIKKLSENAAADFRKDNLGFIFQEYFLLDSLTIRENISVPLTMKKLKPRKIEEIVDSISKRFGIYDQLDKYPVELSGGQRQRASAARAIVKKPTILFADEPTGALDSNSGKELLATLKEANEELKTTILMVTHDAFAGSYADRILIFKDGQIIYELKKNNEIDRRSFYDKIMKTISLIDNER